jgi:hypothetical protein
MWQQFGGGGLTVDIPKTQNFGLQSRQKPGHHHSVLLQESYHKTLNTQCPLL